MIAFRDFIQVFETLELELDTAELHDTLMLIALDETDVRTRNAWVLLARAAGKSLSVNRFQNVVRSQLDDPADLTEQELQAAILIDYTLSHLRRLGLRFA